MTPNFSFIRTESWRHLNNRARAPLTGHVTHVWPLWASCKRYREIALTHQKSCTQNPQRLPVVYFTIFWVKTNRCEQRAYLEFTIPHRVPSTVPEHWMFPVVRTWWVKFQSLSEPCQDVRSQGHSVLWVTIDSGYQSQESGRAKHPWRSAKASRLGAGAGRIEGCPVL